MFEVEIDNNGSGTWANAVVADTVDQALFDAGTADGGVFRVIVADEFGGDTLMPTSRFFEVPLGALAPTTGFVLAYTVEISTPGSTDGVFCNRVTASGDTPAGTLTAQDIACVTTTTTIELDVSNDDGRLDPAGLFQTEEIFSVGEEIIYRIEVINQSQFTATGVTVVDQVAPNTGAIACTGLLATLADGSGGANPSRGTVTTGGGDCTATGFTWTIGDMPTNTNAVLFFAADALATQSNVGNRVNLTADQLTGTIVDEEPTTVN